MKKLFTLLILSVFLAGFLNINHSFAQTPPAPVPPAAPDPCKKGFLGLPHWYEYLELDDNCQIVGPSEDVSTVDDQGNDDPADDVTTTHTRLVVSEVITRVALAVIDILLRVGGMVAFGFIIFSGFKFALSQGNSDQEKAARETAINALVGLVIVIFAIGIVTFIGRQISAS